MKVLIFLIKNLVFVKDLAWQFEYILGIKKLLFDEMNVFLAVATDAFVELSLFLLGIWFMGVLEI